MRLILKKPWLPIEHRVRKELKLDSVLSRIQGKKILVACSGGADSVALLLFFLRLRKSLGLEIIVLHIHHGQKANVQFRDQAAKYVERLAKEWQLPFEKCILNLHDEKESETLLRQKRIQVYSSVLSQTGSDFLALGHHQDDLLETRLIRLIRGTGAAGLQSMSFLRKKVLRPFLQEQKGSLLQYLAEFSVTHCEDPSNQESSNVRNWLRQNWILPMRQQHPEWLVSMGRSLEQIASSAQTQYQYQQIKKKKNEKHNFSNGIGRLQYNLCPSHEQAVLLVRYIQSLGVSDFRHSQIKEIQRQLDRSKNVHTFMAAGLIWNINAQQILAQKK